MSRSSSLLLFALVLAPASAFAGDMEAALVLADAWAGQVMGLALGLWLGMLLLSLLLEAFFKPPTEPKDISGAVWRGLLVLFMLLHVPGGGSLYGRVCHALAAQADSLAAQLSPAAWESFAKAQDAWMEKLAEQYANKSDFDPAYHGSFAAGVLYDTLITFAVTLGQASMWVVTVLAQVLASLLYTVGPLALVFGVPRVSDSIARWLRSFISVLTWPVLSAMMLRIVVAAGTQGMTNASPAFASAATALLMAVIALAVPVVASSLVGGSVGALSAGFGTLLSGAARLAAGAAGAASWGTAAASVGKDVAGGAASAGKSALGTAAGAVMSSGPGSPPGGAPPAASAERAAGHSVAAADLAQGGAGVSASDSSEARRPGRHTGLGAEEAGAGRRAAGPLPKGMVREADGSVAPAPPAASGAAGGSELRGAAIQALGAFAGGVVGGDLGGRHVAHAVRSERRKEAAASGLREFDGGAALEVAAEKAVAATAQSSALPTREAFAPVPVPALAHPGRSAPPGITEEMGSPPKPSTVGPPAALPPPRGAPTRPERPVDSPDAPTMKPTSVMPKKP